MLIVFIAPVKCPIGHCFLLITIADIESSRVHYVWVQCLCVSVWDGLLPPVVCTDAHFCGVLPKKSLELSVCDLHSPALCGALFQ